MAREPLDPFSEVVDERRRWTPNWYSWLSEFVLDHEARLDFLDSVIIDEGQIKFPATQNSSSDPNVLDDYEENTWTPVITFTTPGDLSVGYATQVGKYTKIGRMVLAEFEINLNAFTYTTATGDLRITGWPFNPQVTTFAALGIFNGVILAGLTQLGIRFIGGGITDFMASGTGISNTTLTTTHAPTGAALRFAGTVCYSTAT